MLTAYENQRRSLRPEDDDADAFLESSAGIMIKGLHVQSGHVAEIRAELSSGKAKGL